MTPFDLLELTATIAAIGWAVRECRRARKAMFDGVYGCLTRSGLEANPPKAGSILFFDVDGMHDANERWGYEAVDSRIRAAIAQFRQSRGSSIVARWYSGDEVLAVVPQKDAVGAAERMLQVFREQELGVTIGVCDISVGDWREAVRVASGLVQDAKRRGNRGQIYFAESAI
ncbi:MAG: diguanylate cyclase [Elainellaceae cyanobacterium]